MEFGRVAGVAESCRDVQGGRDVCGGVDGVVAVDGEGGEGVGWCLGGLGWVGIGEVWVGGLVGHLVVGGRLYVRIYGVGGWRNEMDVDVFVALIRIARSI